VKVLVTGAGGFLGLHVVRSLCARGHTVRALVRRPHPALAGGDPGVEVAVADLRSAPLAPLLDEIDAVVHLATTMVGDDFTIFQGTMGATERLLEALARSAVRRLVLVSSFSVYDWHRVGEQLDDGSPLLANPWAGGGYAAAKIWQERLARRLAAATGIALTVMRPGFIWSPDGALPACFGIPLGRAFCVIGPRREPPLTHVVNCADAVAAALAAPGAANRTFNVVDRGGVSAWQWVGARLRREQRGWRFPLPEFVARALVRAIDLASRLIFGPTRKLPSLCDPLRYAARFAPIRVDLRPLEAELAWTPPLASFSECLAASEHRSPPA
jgi:nucleoside-diphosphate-sugar epimerase